jgi:hypothetical protein
VQRKGFLSKVCEDCNSNCYDKPLQCVPAPGRNRFSIFLEPNLLSEQKRSLELGVIMIFVSKHSVAECNVI